MKKSKKVSPAQEPKSSFIYNGYPYNKTYFDGTNLWYTPKKSPKVKSFKLWQLKNGTLVGLFQGSKGDQKEIDFIVKFLLPGDKMKVRTPENMHWVVDLLMKHQIHPDGVKAFVEYYCNWYKTAETVKNIPERNNYNLQTIEHINSNFESIKHDGTLSIEFIGIIIELFSINEKLSPRPNKMYERLLNLFKAYCEGKKDYFQLISGSKAGFR